MTTPGPGRALPIRRVLIIVAMGVAAGFVVVQVRSGIGDLDREDLPTLPELLAASTLAVAGHLLLGAGWNRLLPDVEPRSSLALSFYASQLGKYMPVGIGQPLGQVAMLTELGLAPGRAFSSWCSHIAVTVAAGLAVGAGLAAAPGLSVSARVAAAAGLAGFLLVLRPTLAKILDLARRLLSRLPPTNVLPSQRSLAESFTGAVAYMVLHGCAFAVVAQPLLPQTSAARLAFSYTMAVALSIPAPLPAGLGLREILLAAFIGEQTAVVVTAAIVMRLVVILAEVVSLGLATAWRGVSASALNRSA